MQDLTLRRSLRRSLRQMGWSEVRNGKLLILAAEHFDVFVTVDRNLSFQNKIIDLPLAVIVLCAPTNRLVALRALLPQLLPAIESSVSGHLVLVS